MSEELIEPIETPLTGEEVEAPFQKFQVGDYLLTIDKIKDGYTYRLDKDNERVIPTREVSDHFWRKGRTTASLLKDLKTAGAVPKDLDKTEFRNRIGKVLDVQLSNWNTTEVEQDLKPEEQKIEDRYSEEIYEEAQRVLEEENLLNLVKTVLDYKVAGESRNKMGIFLQCLTKDADEPLIIYGISKQAEGKTYIARKVLDLFPDHQVERITDMTSASIYRIAQEYGKDYYDNKIIDLGELSSDKEGEDDVAQIFRQLVTDEGGVSKQLTLETEDGQKVGNLELDGAPVLIATTTEADKIDLEDMSRAVTYSPDMSMDQKKLVREFQNVEKEYPNDLLYPEEIERLEDVITCCLDILSQTDIEVKNPYTRVMHEIVPLEPDNIKRDYPKVMKMVAETVAKIFYKQRPMTERAGQKYILISWEDMVRGLLINKDFINNMLESTLESEIQVFEKLEKNFEHTDLTYDEMRKLADNGNGINGEAFTNEDVMDLTGMKKNTVYNITNVLDRHSLIFKDRRQRPHKHYIPEDALVTRGITPNTYLQIVDSALDGKGVVDYFNRLLDKWGFENPEKMKQELILDSNNLPFELETGLGGSEDYEDPIYLSNMKEYDKVYSLMIVEQEGSDLRLELKGPGGTRTVHKFTENKDDKDEESEDEEKDFDDWDDAGLNPDNFSSI